MQLLSFIKKMLKLSVVTIVFYDFDSFILKFFSFIFYVFFLNVIESNYLNKVNKSLLLLKEKRYLYYTMLSSETL